jgi:hypothetical protein
MENLVLNFLTLDRYEYKQFYEFFITKLLANFCNFDIFRKNLNFKGL